MVVNDIPEEECRIAVTEDGHLDELFSERTATATNVGNIYKGRVTNVESAIQAAFVDYGEGQSGFLHISDLHPRYFPGESKTERVGKKIPRRDRPLIQQALKRGDEVLVQVLKEGIGTKGPTLTSYLSIPGRLLVAMPGMDRVGVSRKLEDEDRRREARKALDSIDLPEGFGFILRTAGIGQAKRELKRDVAYLMRLWKEMEKRRKNVKAPCALYTESDLLVRTIRDVLRPSIKAIIVDSDSALQRATSFLRVVAPRSAPKVLRYHERTPIFHAFDIERQIELIHDREVPLPSGGKLVIEQTEALVAIDVNSGKSRSARDSESNAYHTNCEAVDEICRQLRLRDLGGLIINDLIDMHSRKNRRLIEERFHQNLKRDRAKTTVLRISDFGLVEMTRQRMRPSVHKANFVTCQHCNGYGEIKSPETVASDTTRHIGYLLQFDRIQRVELVCSPRVASVLLSRKRREMVRLEESWNKRVDVRVSDAIAVDRVDYYAYDERNADVDIEKLPSPKPPTLNVLEKAEREAEAAEKKAEAAEKKAAVKDEPADQTEAGEDDKPTRRKKRRSRRGRRRKGEPAAAGDGEVSAAAESDGQAEPSPDEAAEAKPAEVGSDGDAPRESKSRRSRRRRRKRKAEPSPAAADDSTDAQSSEESAASTDGQAASKRKKTSRRRQASVRVHTLAKEIGVPSREVIEHCREALHLEIKNHMASVPAEKADLIKDALCGDESPAADEPSSEGAAEEDTEDTSSQDKPAGKKSGRSRRSRRGGRRRKRGGPATSESTEAGADVRSGDGPPEPEAAAGDDEPSEAAEQETAEPGPRSGKKAPRRKKKTRGRGAKGKAGGKTGQDRAGGNNGRDEPADSSKDGGRMADAFTDVERSAPAREEEHAMDHHDESGSKSKQPAVETGTQPQGQEEKSNEASEEKASKDGKKSSSTRKRRPRPLYRTRSKVSPTAREAAERVADE